MGAMSTINAESVVKQRYTGAAHRPEAALCCPINYDPRYLKIIPPEVIEKDYGCGDPSKHVLPGETVLDLGSGTGKICFIAAQVVGPAGRVIGVDMTDDMLAIARRNAPIVAQRLGYANVEFRKGRIQDLALDLDRLDAELKQRPIADGNAFLAAQELAADLRVRSPLIASDSIDVVVSNCVLNLVEPAAKQQMFTELFRVLKTGGRAVISDIVSDEDVPVTLQNDPTLWSGCIAGAYREDLFLRAFEQAGFHGIQILARDGKPWQTVNGLEFRSLTVQAFKGRRGEGLDRNQAVIYRGPFKEISDDDGRRYLRGERVAVSDKTFDLLHRAPYRKHFEFIEAREVVPVNEPRPFTLAAGALRHPHDTKGPDIGATTEGAGRCCDGGGNC